MIIQPKGYPEAKQFFAIQFNPYTDPADLVKEHSGFKIGDTVQVKELTGLYKINYITAHALVQAHVYKLGRNGQPNKYNSTVTIDQLMQPGDKQPDKDRNGLDAAQYAKEIFQSGFAIHDYYNTTRQSIVKVLAITKTGRVRIQRLRINNGVSYRKETINDHRVTSQERQVIDWSKLDYEPYGEPELYTPRLHNGEWCYWRDREYIQQAGMKLEWLLD